MENSFPRHSPNVLGVLPACLCAGLIALLAGCATQAPAPAAEPAAPMSERPRLQASPQSNAASVKQLTAAARTALQTAEQSVSDARARQALWTTAVQTLEQARGAAQRVDNEAVIQLSSRVRELVQLGLKQRQSPPVKLFD